MTSTGLKNEAAFEPERFRRPSGPRLLPPRKVPLPRHGEGERFLKGPIPMKWLLPAMRLRGKSLAVALILWQEAFMKKTARVTFSLVNAGGTIDRQAARRALEKLEAEGLVKIERRRGCKHRVTLLPVPLPASIP
jgi:hypothetical protein